MVYFKLIRWKNLLILFFTQVLMKFFIINPVLQIKDIETTLSIPVFLLICISTVLLAGAGYVINDIFDVEIDSVNKPIDKFIGRKISLKKAWHFYWILNSTGILLGLISGILIDFINFVFVHIFSAILLWFYSSRYKKVPLAGNIIIAFLAAFSLFMLWAAEMLNGELLFGPYYKPPLLGNILVMGYISFAFITNLLREIVKDMEDLKGDKAYGCRTLPIVYGIKASCRVSLSIAVVVFAMTIIAQILMAGLGWYLMLGYFVLLIQMPLILLFILLSRASAKRHFDLISKLVKLIMITGVGSMLMVYYSLELV